LEVDLNKFSSASITGTFIAKEKNEYKINQIKKLDLIKFYLQSGNGYVSGMTLVSVVISMTLSSTPGKLN